MGSIVASKYVVTAAHCVEDYDPKNPNDKVEVYVGSREFVSYRKVSVKKVVIKHDYEDFDDTQQLDYNDIAILELQQELDLRIFTPVCLPDYDFPMLNQSFQMWTFFSKNDGSRYLDVQNHTVIKTFDQAFVTTPAAKKGDSGGPFTYEKNKQHVLVGIAIGIVGDITVC